MAMEINNKYTVLIKTVFKPPIIGPNITEKYHYFLLLLKYDTEGY
jgi:hypothetical protein